MATFGVQRPVGAFTQAVGLREQAHEVEVAGVRVAIGDGDALLAVLVGDGAQAIAVGPLDVVDENSTGFSILCESASITSARRDMRARYRHGRRKP